MLSATPFERFIPLLQQAFPEYYDEHFATVVQNALLEKQSVISQIAYACQMSDFVAETLQKQPHLLHQWLQNTPTFADTQHYAQRLNESLNSVENDEQFYRALRLFRHREMAILSFCQSHNLASVEQIFQRLSHLAEALIIGARDYLYQQACQEMGTPQDPQGNPQQLYILGMGKLGGFELNFSSDIDLIFTYPANGETVGARRSVENSKFFTRLGQRLIHALDHYSIDGFVYRTDMRLRPFGENGALALSFNAMEQYYQEQGRDWERYAMIKGRILGAQPQDPYVETLRKLLHPFIYRRYIDFSVIQSLREMKQKIEREIRRRGLVDNIKLGAGGIREIEFIVQVFQLIRGGREITLQQHELLRLLPQLSVLQLLPKAQCDELHLAYLFLRRVENVLQAINDQQTQQLPDNLQDRARLVALCAEFTQLSDSGEIIKVNYPIVDWESFMQTLTQHQQKVRAIFHTLIGNENDDDPQQNENDWQDFLDSDLAQDELHQLLQQQGILPEHQDEIFSRLFQFKQELTRRPIGVRGRDVLAKLMPSFLQSVFAHQASHTLLPRMLTILEKILTRTTYLELLQENPNALTVLIELCSQSKLIAEQVARHPILLDELLDQKSLRNPPHFSAYQSELQQYLLRLPPDDEEQFIDGLRQFKHAALLRVAAADILGALPVMKVSDHLTFLAEAILQAVVNLAWQQVCARFGKPEHLDENERGFVVVGYGKFGGIELGYKSDLDMVFLYDAEQQSQTVGGRKSIDSHQFYLRLAQKIISIFSINTSAGVLYEVDMRLRPSGEAGVLASSFSAFEHYQHHEAWTWEKQSLVRSRAVYGEDKLRQRFEKIRQDVLSQARDFTQLKQDVKAMREKMYQHLANKDSAQFNLKTDQGGITDIEFIAQYLVLRHAPNNPQLAIWSDNVRIFEIMAEHHVIEARAAEQLKHCYTTLRNKIHHLNLLGLPPLVDENEFKTERTFIQNFWQQLFD